MCSRIVQSLLRAEAPVPGLQAAAPARAKGPCRTPVLPPNALRTPENRHTQVSFLSESKFVAESNISPFEIPAIRAIDAVPTASHFVPGSGTMAFPEPPYLYWRTMLPLRSGHSAAQGMRFFSTATGSPSAGDDPAVLVKVGDGVFSRFKHPDILSLDRVDLLTALTESKVFAEDLKDVKLGRCTITVVKDVAGEEPTAEEEKAGMSLKAARTVRDLVQQRAKDQPLFIHVQLPMSATQQPSDEGTRAFVTTS